MYFTGFCLRKGPWWEGREKRNLSWWPRMWWLSWLDQDIGHAHLKRCDHTQLFFVNDSSPGFLIKHFSFHWLSSAPDPGFTVGVPFQGNLSINSPLTCKAAWNEKQCQDMNGSFGKQKKEVGRTTEKETGMGRWLVGVAESIVGSMHWSWQRRVSKVSSEVIGAEWTLGSTSMDPYCVSWYQKSWFFLLPSLITKCCSLVT